MKAAVFFPKKRQRNARFGQLAMNVRIIGFNVQTNTFVFVRKEHPLQICIRNIIIDGPANAKPVCSFKYCLACFSRRTSLKVVTAFQLALLSLLGKIIKVASCSGAVAEKVRQAGRKSPCQWQSWSDLCTNEIKRKIDAQLSSMTLDEQKDILRIIRIFRCHFDEENKEADWYTCVI